MIQEYQIRILPEQAASEEGIKRYLAKEKGLDVRTLNQVRVLKRSIDARQRTIFVNLKVRAYINEFPQDDQYVGTDMRMGICQDIGIGTMLAPREAVLHHCQSP